MVTPVDIARALGRPAPAALQEEWEQWQSWIDDAMLLLEFGDGVHSGLGDLDVLDQPTLNYVVREAVIEKIRRPDPATQVDIQIDDGRVSKRYDTAAGRVSILDAWWAMLAPAADNSSAFSYRPSFARDWVHCAWL